ncbi:MAG: methylated-DNA--[protein]-cysteine S-methyltransferase [Thermomicrobiales bacterium]
MSSPSVDRARYTTLTSPIGPLLIAVSDRGVCAVSWLGSFPLARTLRDLETRGFVPVEAAADPEVRRWAGQLTAYFAGALREFSREIDLQGTSAFTEKALNGILDIPWGEVRTYGEVATGIGMPGSAQAVGNAMGQNPIPVIVPCHRVVRAGGKMGYYTGGAQIKEALLAIEGVTFGRHPGQLRLL